MLLCGVCAVQAKLLCRLLDAATGMAYLHGKGVLHGDLKAGNVLLQSTVHGAYGQVRWVLGRSCVLLAR
jgi:serine/threonine protein kinase